MAKWQSWVIRGGFVYMAEDGGGGCLNFRLANNIGKINLLSETSKIEEESVFYDLSGKSAKVLNGLSARLRTFLAGLRGKYYQGPFGEKLGNGGAAHSLGAAQKNEKSIGCIATRDGSGGVLKALCWYTGQLLEE